MNVIDECAQLTDAELESQLKFLASRERHNIVKLLSHLAEYDRRQLCIKKGHSSLFSYCRRALGYDEGAAYRRIRAARVARKWPEVLDMLEKGEINLTALIVLHPVLTDNNRRDWFRRAFGKSRRELEMMVASVLPHPARADFARRLPVPGGWSVAVTAPIIEVLPSASPESAAASSFAPEAASNQGQSRSLWEWQAIVPISMDRVRIGFDAAVSVWRLIERAQQIFRHKYPQGRVEDILREALEILLDRKDPQRKFAHLRNSTKTPSAEPKGRAAEVAYDAGGRLEKGSREPRFLRAWKNGRYIPARVKSAVWQRDDGRCAWREQDGAVCGSKDCLEYDHVRPFARGGRSDGPRNIRLLCRLHNQAAAIAAGVSAGPASA